MKSATQNCKIVLILRFRSFILVTIMLKVKRIVYPTPVI